jgi:hypothetical protein
MLQVGAPVHFWSLLNVAVKIIELDHDFERESVRILCKKAGMI